MILPLLDKQRSDLVMDDDLTYQLAEPGAERDRIAEAVDDINRGISCLICLVTLFGCLGFILVAFR